MRRVKISITVYTSLHSTTYYKARPFPPNLYRMNIKLHYPARPCFYWSPVPPSTAQPIRHRFTNTYKRSLWFRGALNAAITHLTVSMINGIPTRPKFPTSPVGMGEGEFQRVCTINVPKEGHSFLIWSALLRRHYKMENAAFSRPARRVVRRMAQHKCASSAGQTRWSRPERLLPGPSWAGGMDTALSAKKYSTIIRRNVPRKGY